MLKEMELPRNEVYVKAITNIMLYEARLISMLYGENQ
jgi:hypothetical protein